MKYLKKFNTDSERVGYEDSENYLEPYVSYVEGDNSVHYNKVETKLIVYYDIQDISAPTTIFTNYESSVKSIDIDGKEAISEFSQGNVTYQFDAVGQHIIKFEFNDPTTVGNNAPLLYNLTTAKRVVIPNTFTAIGDNAFNSCSGLTTVSIGNGVTSIGNYAFVQCSGLTSVTIGNGVTEIGQQAFNNCYGLSSITIPDSVTSIGNSAFYNCRSLTSVTIPDSVTSISGSAFAGCSSLTSVTISNGVTSIGSSTFERCSGLTSVIIPDSVTSIGGYAFAQCYNLTSVTIPNSITSIGQGVFAYCSGLTSVTIGSSVTSIGNYTFQSCNSLTSITSLATTAPTIDSSTFQTIKTEGTLTVPSGSSGYDVWMGTSNYYLGKYGWTKVEQ